MYLDYAESQAMKGNVMYMKDWSARLDAFLQFNEKAILTDGGTVSHEVAVAIAEKEYGKYQVKYDISFVSDFDQYVLDYPTLKNALNDLDKTMLELRNR